MEAVYIHLPFCSNICSYCDFCKVFYNEKTVNDYLNALEKEIKINYKGEIIKTIYVGGGTPTSLNIDQLNQLFNIIAIFKKANAYEFAMECNVEDTSVDKIKLLKEKGVNRLSIGVQSFNGDNLKFLKRKHTKKETITLIKKLKEYGFENVSVDLIYALPQQSLDDLKIDIEEFLKLKINHISCYSLIIEKHTALANQRIQNIDEDLDAQMYQYIVTTLKKNGFIHYEISNFAKPDYESKHNLVYWNNEHYYGFGAGVSGYIGNVRYDNTRSISNYIKGEYRLNEHILSMKEIVENEIMLGLRKTEGLNLTDFYKKYEIDLEKKEIVKELLAKGYLIKANGRIYIAGEYLYVSNTILVEMLGGF